MRGRGLLFGYVEAQKSEEGLTCNIQSVEYCTKK